MAADGGGDRKPPVQPSSEMSWRAPAALAPRRQRRGRATRAEPDRSAFTAVHGCRRARIHRGRQQRGHILS
jgi:hypothetical protein